MSKRKRKPTLTEVKRFLNSCAFDINEPGYMKIIADVEDKSYYINRAIEYLSFLDITDKDSLKKAIQLLTLAVLQDIIHEPS